MKNLQLKYEENADEMYMSAEQINFFKEKLLHWRNTMLAENDLYKTQLLRENTRLPDILDQSVEVMNRTMVVLEGQRSRMIIQQIAAALKRIEEGSYGYCLQSGEEIGLRRLLAWPIATLSVEAQEQQERRQRLFSV